MKRTLYNDGVEVDASDLTNTETSKVDEILLTRRVTSRYGVVEGLGCSNSTNRINIDTGRLVFRNGEVGILDSPITGITGASFEAHVSTFVGLRLSDVSSNPKPHEVDPTLFDTRADSRLTAELFVAADQTDAARTTALQAAIDAELNDGNYVLLAEFVGTGTGLGRLPSQNTPLPKDKGGDDPYRDDVKTKNQKGALVSLYNDNVNDQFPIASAEDHFHRSLIGTGTPNKRNPHGTTLTDIGGDTVLDQVITKHQSEFHANGIVGLEPDDTDTDDPVGDFTPIGGSFAWGVDNFGTVTVRDLLGTPDSAFEEVLVIQGKEKKKGQIATIPDGVIAPKISFASTASGMYYIVCSWGSSDQDPVFDKILKSTFDALCVLDNGTPTWLNNAVNDTPDPSSGVLERKFFVIGLVQWNGTSFTNLDSNSTIAIPAGTPNGELVYSNSLPVGHPLRIPPNKKTLDLRRFGNITNQEVQKRTIRLDRMVEPVISEDDFVVHAGIRIVNGTAVSVGGGLHASPVSGGDNTILKHLTDFDAFDLFGHRARRGIAQHGLSQHSGALDGNDAPADEDASNSGFQSSRDKWRQDNLTMTVFKWADLGVIDADESAMGDAAAVATADPFSSGSGGYIVYRRGFLKNFAAQLHKMPNSAHNLQITAYVRSIGTPIGTFVGNPNAVRWVPPLGSSTNQIVLGFQGPPPAPSDRGFSCTNVVDQFEIDATPDDPRLIQITRLKSGGGNDWRNLMVTAEYHYTS